MSRQVTIASGKANVQLPNGFAYDAADVVILTDEQFDMISASLIPGTVIDNGAVATSGDAVTDQAANVAPIATPGSATAADAANKVNEVINALTGPETAMAEA